MLPGTKKLFPTDYKAFRKEMISAAKKGQLPVYLELKDTKNFSLKDFQDMFSEFEGETGLEIAGLLVLEHECCSSKLHMQLRVGLPEMESTVLQ